MGRKLTAKEKEIKRIMYKWTRDDNAFHKRIEWIKANNPLHKKLEQIITRNFWVDFEFDEEEFHIYCEAIKYEAKLIGYDAFSYLNPFIGSEEYISLIKMSDDDLKRHLLTYKSTS